MSQMVLDCVIACVFSCEVVQSTCWNEMKERDEIVWGLRVQFSDGEIIYIPDISTKWSDAERLRKRLEGATLSAEFLPDIVDDYLGELYG
ncbi:hypothetical protein SDC9_199194 [bioreactor metagenome]|uniref:Uncharacterized protein n=1 Tax=bioreactor metagenome TaxID=1076179 RepID=A0A645IKJ6_9ZZZZ